MAVAGSQGIWGNSGGGCVRGGAAEQAHKQPSCCLFETAAHEQPLHANLLGWAGLTNNCPP